MRTESADDWTSMRVELSKSSVAAYFTPVISTVSRSQPVISTEPFMFSTDNRPPGFKLYEYEKFSVKRSDRSPHIMSSQPIIKTERPHTVNSADFILNSSLCCEYEQKG
jgi:hypothetical protein